MYHDEMGMPVQALFPFLCLTCMTGVRFSISLVTVSGSYRQMEQQGMNSRINLVESQNEYRGDRVLYRPETQKQAALKLKIKLI